MAFDALLLETCTIQAKALVQSGYEKTEDWSDVVTDVPCRKNSTNSPRVEDSEKRLNVDDDMFFLQAGTPVVRGNQIIYKGDTYDVLKVNELQSRRRIHHLQVTARNIDHQ